MIKKISLTILGLIIIGAILWGPIASNVEQLKYNIIQSYGNIEIRDYEPIIVAETMTTGNREEAISKGFRTIADYIFGNNISMTAPVTQQNSEEIAMTAPVTQKIEGDKWQIRFVMPKKYNITTLPKPNNEDVKIKEIPEKRFVTIRFSGTSSKENLKNNKELLEKFIKSNKLKPISQPTYSFFNPPWTLPFLRRNEIMIELPKTNN